MTTMLSTPTAPPVAREPGAPGIWIAIARLLMIAVFAQSIFAGLILSGESWGRTAHRLTAFGLITATVLAGIAALLALRHTEGGARLAGSLLALAAMLVLQTVLGIRSAAGERLLWLHVPLGVALTGFTANLEAAARRLRRLAISP
jgi:hypothetical protein